LCDKQYIGEQRSESLLCGVWPVYIVGNVFCYVGQGHYNFLKITLLFISSYAETAEHIKECEQRNVSQIS